MVDRIEGARPAVVYTLLAAFLAAVFVPIALLRLVDPDEGTYLLVSRLVVEGRLPYHDFFYPQMYLLPYVYGLWMMLTGYSWYAARLLSAGLCVGLGLLVCRQVSLVTGARAWGVAATVLFACSGLVFGWYPLVKSYALVTLLVFGAYAVLSTGSRWRWAWSGLLLGLAVMGRIYLVGALPAFLLEIHRTERDVRARLTQLVRFGLAFAATFLPAGFLYLMDPETFLFNIVGNQLIRTQIVEASMRWWDEKTYAIRLLLSLQGAEGAMTFQFILVALLCVGGWVSALLSRQRLPLVTWIALCLFAASHVATPVYPQYFCILLPFLLVDAVVLTARLLRESNTPRLRHLVAVGAVAYVAVSPLDVYHYTVAGDLSPGRSGPADWRIATIRAVGQSIDRHLRPERPFAIAFWPGYFVETRAAILPGMENHFGPYFASKLTSQQVSQFRLVTFSQVLGLVRGRNVDVVAVANQTPNRAALRDELLESGFVSREKIASTEIFTLASPAGAPPAR